MSTQRVIFKRIALAIILIMFVSFAFLLPSVFAQGETPTPLPEVTPEPLEIPEIEQGYGAQSPSQPQASAELGGEWGAQMNISNTTGESLKPKIAAGTNGVMHVVWRETVGGKQEIYYVQIDGLTQPAPTNVSNSPSFNSDSPQLVVDNAGRAHIVWQEEDNDQPDDFETLYSRCDETGCTSPLTLSDGLACGSLAGDWKATDPSIAINGNNNLMVVWMSFEPNPRLYTMFSLWSALGSPPSNRTGCNLAAGSYYYPVLAGDSNGDFHLLRMNASNGILYSKYSGGSWSANQTIGTGLLPIIHVGPDNKIHVAWWNANVPPSYRSKESGGSTWSAVENVFNSTTCSDLSLITDGDNLPRLACANGAIIEASRQASGWTETVIVPSMAGRPDLAEDASGGLHLVWSDSSLGNWEIYYSSDVPESVQLEITDSAGNIVNTLALNSDGWPIPNPLTANVTLYCPAGGPDCDRYTFDFNLNSTSGSGRFFLYDTTRPPDGNNCVGDYPGVQYTLESFVLSCNDISLFAGQTVKYTWKLWVQPSTATQINVQAEYGLNSNTKTISVPKAAIHPVAFIPGEGVSNQFISNTYYDSLLRTLEKMGYERGQTLFPWDYNPTNSFVDTAAELTGEIAQWQATAVEVPWVWRKPGNQNQTSFDFISHSAGVMVTRAYVQLTSDTSSLSNLKFWIQML